MSDVSSAPIPAGWYPDPAGSFQQRWWTGTTWTNDFAQYRPSLVHSTPATAGHGAQAIQDAVAAREAAAAAQPAAAIAESTQAAEHSRASHAHVAPEQPNQSSGAHSAQSASSSTQTIVRPQTEHGDAAEPTATRVDPLPSFTLPAADQAPQTRVAQPNAASAILVPVRAAGAHPAFSSFAESNGFGASYQPFTSKPEVRLGVREQATVAHTFSVWLLALFPVLIVGSALAIALFAEQFYTVAAIALLGVILLFASLGLAVLDARSLRLDGHDTTASPAWVLLTPIAYLVARTAAVAKETGRLVPWPLLVALLVYAGIAALYFVPSVFTIVFTINPL